MGRQERTMQERLATPRGVGKSKVSKSAAEASERHRVEIDSLCAGRGRLDGRAAMAVAGALDGGSGDSGSAGGRPPTPSRRAPSRRAPPSVAASNAWDDGCRARADPQSHSRHQNKHPPPPHYTSMLRAAHRFLAACALSASLVSPLATALVLARRAPGVERARVQQQFMSRRR